MKIANEGNAPAKKCKVLVCQGTGCTSSKSEQIRLALEDGVKKAGLSNVEIDFTGCHGFCQQGPIVVVEPDGIFYAHVKVEDAEEIVNSHLKNNQLVERLFYHDPVTDEPIAKYHDIKFYMKQKRLILRNCGHINPERIDDYIAVEGYRALKKVLTAMTPRQVIDEVKKSGLRGRGGAGFSTGQKWEYCAIEPGDQKYMICNADEGDPGAFMDRSTMEGDPHTVIEGMTIAAYAIGASEGYIYCRAEYPLAIKRLLIAIRQAEERGYLGDKIMGTDFSFKMHVKEGAGAFVCGEETALMASIEGKRGMPRSRPPFPAQSGLWGKPSTINNVKTLATIPVIINRGAEWYAAIGVGKSKGTTVFALTGKIANSGLVEVPLGTKLSEIIFEIGGGIPRGKRFKAVQTGGPSGGCLPSSYLNSPVDYETLATAGSIIGSGGMVVLDEDNCMVDMARYFLSFTQLESCGKCIQCRWGTRQMLNVLEDITSGKGRPGDIDFLLELSKAVSVGSRCGLGQTAPNPVISTIRYFRDEYEAHIKKLHCPAAVCKGLVKAPCSHTCPAGIDVPRYIRAVAEGDVDTGLAVIRERIPFPAVCGYVCIHPCEAKCRRGQIDEPVSIRALKRYIYDNAAKNGVKPKIAAPSGKKVAVIGSGPAGLTAAYYLAGLGGHAVTVFEALPEAGGMMRVGIPRYRLPGDVLDAEIDYIKRAGVELKLNTRVESIAALKEQGYDAVFIAAGAHAGLKMRVPGEEAPGVMDCVTMLRDVTLGKKVRVGEKVAVIGGGNAAMDASRTARRLGAKEVTIFYRRTREEMPAADDEIDEALEEGIKIEFLTNPSKIVKSNGHLTMTCVRMKLGDIDDSGRPRPVVMAGSEFDTNFDTIISAIGQAADLPEALAVAKNKNGTVKADPDTLAADAAGVFAGGDVVSGPASVIEAIAAGRQAAVSIDKYLGGKGVIEEKLTAPEVTRPYVAEEGGVEKRAAVPLRAAGQRLKDFKAGELGYTRALAEQEASRCLRCDLEED
ncbi:MAG: NADH-ubiquinone oxidoreductase-F iron-sulfur binding region domain-containing protein [Dehalococcoidales bacterium]|jgi:NADH-quinone oxidoreductase subunit F